MNNSEFSEFASKKLAPLRHDGFERASFKYFLESGTVNASFLQLLKELCDDYHAKILNENILESDKKVCELNRWFYSCKLYNINKGCDNCEHFKQTFRERT